MTILKQPSATIMLVQLNKDNQTSLTDSQVRFGTPDPVAEPVKGDTNLPILAKPGGGYVGSVLGYYDRLSLTTLFGFKVVLIVEQLDSYADVVTAFSKQYGLGLVANEVVNNPLDPNNLDQDGNVIYTIVANKSLVYTGQVTVSILGTPANAIMTENGFALTTEDGRFLVTEAA